MAPLSVGIGELQVSNNPDDVITALGLGSCVAIILYDRPTSTYGMLHAMLPTASGKNERGKPARSVEDGLPALVKAMIRAGAKGRGLEAVLVGGAAMFEFTGPSVMDIGDRNVEMAGKLLQERRIPILVKDVGGSSGRTVILEVGSGNVLVRTQGSAKQLICLRERVARKLAA